jgi:hypothetical protein
VGHRNDPPREFPNRLVKVDTGEREATVWEEDATYPSEPVFVPDPDGGAEDEGVVLSVVLEPDEEATWLTGDPGEVADLLDPYPAERMSAYPVSTAVNSPANDGPALIEEVEVGF